MDQTVYIPLESIYWLDPADVTDQQIADMAASILVHGQIQPIVVCTQDEKGYRGVVGRLRYEGLKHRWRESPTGRTIMARIHKFEDDVQIKMWQLAENLHRREIGAMQKARQYKELYNLLQEQHGEEATIKTLVVAIEDSTGNKESHKTVQHYLSLTKLEPDTQQSLTGETMTLRHGLELLRVKDPEKQVELAKSAETDEVTVKDLHYRVDAALVDERRKKQFKRLKKKAKELKAEGIKVFFENPYISYDQYNEESKTYHRFWSDPPEKCLKCPKKGVILRGNFRQDPVCTDLKCYDKMQKQKGIDIQKQVAARNKQLDEDLAKVYNMTPDARHWRLAVYGLFDTYQLCSLLNVDRTNMEESVWKALCKLDEKQCQTMLICKAVSLTLGPPDWKHSHVKKWVVKEFNLTPEVFPTKE